VDKNPWEQINISYTGETPKQREAHAIGHLGQVLPAADTAGLITSWWFIRKGAWRIRYLPAQNQDRHH
jgi:thiopeptide-type bacteriocin biosynthesis protein